MRIMEDGLDRGMQESRTRVCIVVTEGDHREREIIGGEREREARGRSRGMEQVMAHRREHGRMLESRIITKDDAGK